MRYRHHTLVKLQWRQVVVTLQMLRTAWRDAQQPEQRFGLSLESVSCSSRHILLSVGEKEFMHKDHRWLDDILHGCCHHLVTPVVDLWTRAMFATSFFSSVLVCCLQMALDL